MKVILAIIVIVAAIIAFFGFGTMIAVGVFHAVFLWPAITISYWQGIEIALTINMLLGMYGARNSAANYKANK